MAKKSVHVKAHHVKGYNRKSRGGKVVHVKGHHVKGHRRSRKSR